MTDEEYDVGVSDLEDARRVIRDSQTSADRLIQASRELEHIVYGVSRDDSSLSATEYDINDARTSLEQHKLMRAKRSVRRAEKALATVESDVVELRRNIAMLNRLLKEKTLTEAELEIILRRLRNATGAAEIGEVGYAADEVEQLIGDLVVDSAVALNPFLFRNFWLGVDTRWPAGGDNGIMIVRICNDGSRPMPEMRLAPPVPEGWQCVPESIDLPIIRPGDVILVRFEVKPGLRFALDEIPLSRKLAIQTGYEISAGQVKVTMRVQNRSMETIRDLLLQPWMPPGYKAEVVPLVQKLSPDETGVVVMPLVIDMGDGGESTA
ncbi:MAG: hypothetical protein H2066_00255 [Candidatus Poseidoniales archaeon]|nr:hypothetical protein [Candidatus Poseidoniales archaeon]|tara:strand:- start:529 stop:1497 length:969 start_codon:yes stop_codon:yes gene_type:complete